MEEEWDDFQPDQVLSSDISGKLWNNIHKNTRISGVSRPYFRWVAVAASVLLVIGLSCLFVFKQKVIGSSATSVAQTKKIFNPTPQKMALTLTDGSTVELLPNSRLSYPEKFDVAKRDVILNGEANFNIANDVEKPFSVYSNPILITVLGTRFTVKSYEAANITKVILSEGKVMIQVPGSSKNKNDYFLTPGDVFLISNDSLSARTLHLEKDKDGRFVFNNYPLDVVFDQLQIIYNTKIIYNKAELGNRTFIGKIDKKDSLPHILKSITLLTNFGLHQQGDSFIVGN